MEKLREIDFWENDYDLSIAFHTKGDTTSHLSLSKKDKAEVVTHDEIINALALGIIGIGNQVDVRYEEVLRDIVDKCIEIEKSQRRMSDMG